MAMNEMRLPEKVTAATSPSKPALGSIVMGTGVPRARSGVDEKNER